MEWDLVVKVQIHHLLWCLPIVVKPNPLPLFSSSRLKFNRPHIRLPLSDSGKWRSKVSFFPSFQTKGRDVQSLKEELYETIAPLDGGAEATPDDQQHMDELPLIN
ncbi:hypothetical protein L6164_026808 [Bauhinia variegata]|uniref:Uncharacterized protein n=1 Tax=Bauhinia variegata TaxID=167791 RepID=A0ACB9LRA1_BAUVA|nr:hypothetical protein L6164_026808 [Bauhinia variegata]